LIAVEPAVEDVDRGVRAEAVDGAAGVVGGIVEQVDAVDVQVAEVEDGSAADHRRIGGEAVGQRHARDRERHAPVDGEQLVLRAPVDRHVMAVAVDRDAARQLVQPSHGDRAVAAEQDRPVVGHAGQRVVQARLGAVGDGHRVGRVSLRGGREDDRAHQQHGDGDQQEMGAA
jgi:hypothetical protein